jgi:lipopolysaccharide export system protein LptA
MYKECQFFKINTFTLTFRNTIMRLLTLVISLICTFCWASQTWSQNGVNSTTPIEIEADRMETSQEDGSVLFSGNIQANQGNLIINADEMTVLYTKAEPRQGASAGTAKKLTQKIEKIMARGNVKIVQGNWVAAGDTMDFNADDRIVILAGNAKAWQDQNMVTGEKIVLYLNEGKSVVERSTGEGERVKALIYPSSKKKKDPLNR